MTPDSHGRTISMPVARVDELRPDAGLARPAGGHDLALFLVDDEPVVYEGHCRHRGGPLAAGFVRDGTVTCPLHWWRYDLRTGELIANRAVRLRRYPAEVRDGEVVVTIETDAEPTAAGSLRERLLARARATAEPSRRP